MWRVAGLILLVLCVGCKSLHTSEKKDDEVTKKKRQMTNYRGGSG